MMRSRHSLLEARDGRGRIDGARTGSPARAPCGDRGGAGRGRGGRPARGAGIGRAGAGAKGRRRIPAGYGQVDPRTADRVPLTLSLRDGVPLFPGDPQFTWEVFTDTRTPAHDDGGFLLEQITSLGTHTASHISAPVHFILGGRRLNQLNEDFTLMPLAVIDVRARIRAHGPDFFVTRADLQRYERQHGRIPAAGLRAPAHRLRAAVLPRQRR